MDASKQFTSIVCSTVPCIQSFSSAINYHIIKTKDEGKHTAKLVADKLLSVMDAASISEFKVFQVHASIVIKQNYCRYICSQTECKCWMQTIFFASIGCSIVLCIQSNASSCNYCNQAKKRRHICSKTECKFWIQTKCHYWLNAALFPESRVFICPYDCNYISNSIHGLLLYLNFHLTSRITSILNFFIRNEKLVDAASLFSLSLLIQGGVFLFES